MNTKKCNKNRGFLSLSPVATFLLALCFSGVFSSSGMAFVDSNGKYSGGTSTSGPAREDGEQGQCICFYKSQTGTSWGSNIHDVTVFQNLHMGEVLHFSHVCHQYFMETQSMAFEGGYVDGDGSYGCDLYNAAGDLVHRYR